VDFRELLDAAAEGLLVLRWLFEVRAGLGTTVKGRCCTGCGCGLAGRAGSDTSSSGMVKQKQNFNEGFSFILLFPASYFSYVLLPEPSY
jgi:hypothetical protein